MTREDLDMFIKLNSDVVININYITAIIPCEEDIVNNKGNKIKYLLCMTDGQRWYMTEEDYYEISQRVGIERRINDKRRTDKDNLQQ